MSQFLVVSDFNITPTPRTESDLKMKGEALKQGLDCLSDVSQLSVCRNSRAGETVSVAQDIDTRLYNGVTDTRRATCDVIKM